MPLEGLRLHLQGHHQACTILQLLAAQHTHLLVTLLQERNHPTIPPSHSLRNLSSNLVHTQALTQVLTRCMTLLRLLDISTRVSLLLAIQLAPHMDRLWGAWQ
jgi:hypothetical protein